MEIYPRWSGRIVRNGSMKNEFTCSSCSIPCVVVRKKLSEDGPTGCIDENKRTTEDEYQELVFQEEQAKKLKKVV